MKMSKQMTNAQIAQLFRAVAAALELSPGDNHFRIVAYERAADAVEHASSEVKDLWDAGKLRSLSGIGEKMALHLDELFRTGTVKHFEAIVKDFPEAFFTFLNIPGVGPKNAIRLAKELKISDGKTALSQLKAAAVAGKIAQLEGMGETSQQNILLSMEEYQRRGSRLVLPVATTIAEEVTAWLKQLPEVKRVETLGSLRRQASTIGDVDLAVASTDSMKVIKHFTQYPKATRVLDAGEHKASLILANNIQVDMMVQPPQAYGALLQHFTGSKHHNIALRELALKKGLSLSEYGIKHAEKIETFATEEKFYARLGLPWIPPELREGENEIELARQKKLPSLVELSNIQGDLHIHSNLPIEPSHDAGTSSLSELAAEAKKLGYSYIGVTEHNPAQSGHTTRDIVQLITRKTAAITRYNQTHVGKGAVHIFNGLEIDILPDGRRALPDEALELLDYACVSLHASFRGSAQSMTARVLRALDHPKVRFLAHPTARLLQEREGVEFDWDALFDFCVRQKKWLEINSWYNRLDLPDDRVHEAIKHGVKLVIDSDSHDAQHLDGLRFGVSVARRGWATKKDIVNTSSLKQMQMLLEK